MRHGVGRGGGWGCGGGFHRRRGLTKLAEEVVLIYRADAESCPCESSFRRGTWIRFKIASTRPGCALALDKCCVSQSRRSTSLATSVLEKRHHEQSRLRSVPPSPCLPSRTFAHLLAPPLPVGNVPYNMGEACLAPDHQQPPFLPHCIGSTHRRFQICRSGRRLSVCPIILEPYASRTLKHSPPASCLIVRRGNPRAMVSASSRVYLMFLPHRANQVVYF